MARYRSVLPLSRPVGEGPSSVMSSPFPTCCTLHTHNLHGTAMAASSLTSHTSRCTPLFCRGSPFPSLPPFLHTLPPAVQDVAALSGTAHSIIDRWTSDVVFAQLKDALLAAAATAAAGRATGMVFAGTGLLGSDSREPPLSRNIAQTGEGERCSMPQDSCTGCLNML